MVFDAESFARTRPYLYHLTASANLPAIRARGKLCSAMQLCEEAGERSALSGKRKRCVELRLRSGEHAVLRDQAPLHAGNVSLEGGWTFEDVLLDLNSRVFFCPGKECWLTRYARAHFDTYEGTDAVVLRMPTAAILANAEAEFSRFNSGAPRTSGGRKSPRGPATFQARPNWPPSETVEVTLRCEIDLPATVDLWRRPHGRALPERWECL